MPLSYAPPMLSFVRGRAMSGITILRSIVVGGLGASLSGARHRRRLCWLLLQSLLPPPPKSAVLPGRLESQMVAALAFSYGLTGVDYIL